MSLETPWDAGRLGRANGPHRLLFGHMHEDAEIERVAFLNKRRVFCIASAGCTAARLCDEHEVIACDINPVQLTYAERRLQGAAAQIGDAERAMAFARTFMPLVGWRAQGSSCLSCSVRCDRTSFVLANASRHKKISREL